ncbi:hypothetical protein [Chryseobacterium indoltheticum]|uniref:hypothetical protein n=1 Tax=Chryseobacterium indoltheticum TaxID=254 RepID=UPI003F494A54
MASEYLLALFNSTLFAFYNSEAKDRETKSVIENFPVVTTAHKKYWDDIIS